MGNLNLTRRDILAAGVLGAGAVVAGMAGCAPATQKGAEEEEKLSDTSQQVVDDTPADRTENTTLLVIGAGGCAGSIAVARAHALGVPVIGIDAQSGFAACNFCTIAGCMGVETEQQKQEERCATIEEVFNYLYNKSMYQMNPPLLSNLLHTSGKACQMILDTGMPVVPFFAGAPADAATDPNLTMYGFGVGGQERAAFFDIMIDGADVRWKCTAERLITDDSGAVIGARCKDSDGSTVDFLADNTFVATGGFIQNGEMSAQYYGGCELYCPPGNPYNDGSGIKMCLDIGAQMGKNFSTSGSALGGGNSKASALFAQFDPTGCPAFVLPFLGGLYVNKQGDRIMKESSVTEGMMWAAEPMIRNNKWYVVVDQASIDKMTNTPVVDLMGNAKEHMAKGDLDLWNVVLTEMQASVDKAIEEGWAWKADTIEQLAQATNMPNLPETFERYNGYCRAGKDTQMFKDPAYLVEMSEGPFYILENETIGWLTMCGIKTDPCCRALNTEGDIIPGLFVGGGDADLWSVPYIWGSSTSGFSNASGYIVAETVAGNKLEF